MAFENRIVEYPNRYTLTDSTTNTVLGTYDLTRAEGTVAAAGTPITAENLNSEITAAAETASASINNAVSVDSSGNVHFKNLQSGSTAITVSATKSVTSKTVTFPTAFTKIPKINLTLISSSPQECAVGASNISTAGFTINLYRSTKVNTGIQWMAFI